MHFEKADAEYPTEVYVQITEKFKSETTVYLQNEWVCKHREGVIKTDSDGFVLN